MTADLLRFQNIDAARLRQFIALSEWNVLGLSYFSSVNTLSRAHIEIQRRLASLNAWTETCSYRQRAVNSL